MFLRVGKKKQNKTKKACLCFGFGEAKDMFACGRCPAPLPPHRPRDITASCIDASLTCEQTQTHTHTHTHTHAYFRGGSPLQQNQTNRNVPASAATQKLN